MVTDLQPQATDTRAKVPRAGQRKPNLSSNSAVFWTPPDHKQSLCFLKMCPGAISPLMTDYQPKYKWHRTQLDENDPPSDIDRTGMDGTAYVGHIWKEFHGPRKGGDDPWRCIAKKIGTN